MLINDCKQGSEEWHNARCGIPTASEFSKIITSKGAPSAQILKYAQMKAAEIIASERLEGWEGNQWTERGKELEDCAVAYYELQTGNITTPVGFVTHDNGLSGCSPDRFVGDTGLLEIKCPSPAVHIEYIRSRECPSNYFQQVQGQIYVTGREWCDFMSYHPKLPRMIVRVGRDEEFIKKLHEAIIDFSDEVQSIVKDIRNHYG